MRAIVTTAIAIGLGGCPICDDEAVPDGTAGERWLEADELFHRGDPRWLGGDGAYSIDLGGERTLWLFGDSFIATSPAHVRSESAIVRNSIAVMTGLDPLTATIEYAWREPASSFFPEAGDRWFWPLHGIRLDGGPLILFLAELAATPGQGLGFEGVGYRAVRIPDPDRPPAEWTVEPLVAPAVPHDPTATIGNCTMLDHRGHLVAMAVDAEHRGMFVRYDLGDLAIGDLSNRHWWNGTAWVPDGELAGMPAVVKAGMATECSLSGDDASGWLMVASVGFGATGIGVYVADKLEGPYELAGSPFVPPESMVDDAFVYAAKAHPALLPNGAPSEYSYDLVVTFADNSFTFADLFDPDKEKSLYWPHFVRFQLFYPSC